METHSWTHSCMSSTASFSSSGWASSLEAPPHSTLSLLERLSEHHKCVFREEVLARLSVKDRFLLARVSSELRAACLTSGLPVVGDGRRRVTMFRDGTHSIACGPVHVFQYCVAQGCPFLNPHTPELAALVGNLKVLTWAHEMGCPWNRLTCLRAACGTTPSHLACLVYAHTHGCAFDARVFADAAATAPITTLKYLFDEGCPYDESLAESAAAHGRLDVLETFPSTAKSGDIAVTSAAASHGHLPCLKFAVERLECDVDERALSTAAAWGHKECVRYLVAARCPGWDAYDEAWSPGSPQW